MYIYLRWGDPPWIGIRVWSLQIRLTGRGADAQYIPQNTLATACIFYIGCLQMDVLWMAVSVSDMVPRERILCFPLSKLGADPRWFSGFSYGIPPGRRPGGGKVLGPEAWPIKAARGPEMALGDNNGANQAHAQRGLPQNELSAPAECLSYPKMLPSSFLINFTASKSQPTLLTPKE